MRKVLFAFTSLFLFVNTYANNVRVTDLSAASGTLSFNLSWDNSWNASTNVDTLYPGNWDAVWLVVKVQSNADNLWHHCNLAGSGHTVSGSSASLELETQGDNVGIFVRRSAAGHGNIENASVSLQLGTLPTGTSYNYKVVAIEMVHIPSGGFYVGDGNPSTGAGYFNNILVNSSSSIAASALFTGSAALAATYPKGYGSFYAMKYEVSQEQYADFLNTLTYDQQANFFAVAPNAARNSTVFGTISGAGSSTTRAYIRIDSPGINNTRPAVVGINYDAIDPFNDDVDGANTAQVNLGTDKLTAYLDWVGLRPMTELEYEKMGRGSRINGNPVKAVLNEYAWGTIDLVNHSNTSVTDKNYPDERVVGAVVNGRAAVYGSAIPLRCGVFADSATGRSAAGAGFYGNMELTGNAYEIVVSVNANGASFTGALGDGILNENGWANQTNWPSSSSAGAYGLRGGSCMHNVLVGVSAYNAVARLSSRYYMETTRVMTGHDNIGTGGRGVR